MKLFKRLKYLLVASLILSVGVSGLLLLINFDRVNITNISLILFLIVALGPNLMHIYVAYSLGRNFFPQKEVPRSFIISFKIVSIVAWIVWIGLVVIIIGVTVYSYNNARKDELHPLALPAFTAFILLTCLIPFQLIASSKLLSLIQQNHSKNLLGSFN